MQILAKYGSTSSGERTSVFGGLLRDEVRALIFPSALKYFQHCSWGWILNIVV